METYPTCRENVFGPAVEGCSRFDFTYKFENTILSILPSCLLLVIGATRLYILSGRPTCHATTWEAWIKVVRHKDYCDHRT